MGRNQGWVNVGMDHDTADFATDSILSWWKHMGCKAYPKATELVIMADAGGAEQPFPAMESGSATLGGPHGIEHSRIALPAWNQQVEQNRTPDVLIYHSELEGKAPGQL